MPGHVCVQKEMAQLKAIELQEGNEILSNEVLEAVMGMDGAEDEANLSLHAIAGTSTT